jgi:hypothetical protein
MNVDEEGHPQNLHHSTYLLVSIFPELYLEKGGSKLKVIVLINLEYVAI